MDDEQFWLNKLREQFISPGCTIRSYDFPTGNDDWIEGKLLKIGKGQEDLPCVKRGCTDSHFWIKGTVRCESCPNPYCDDGVDSGGLFRGRRTEQSAGLREIISRDDEICTSCLGKGYLELDLNGKMFYPHISSIKSRGKYGPGIVLITDSKTLNYPGGIV